LLHPKAPLIRPEYPIPAPHSSNASGSNVSSVSPHLQSNLFDEVMPNYSQNGYHPPSS
jgi:hypothetical protein